MKCCNVQRIGYNSLKKTIQKGKREKNKSRHGNVEHCDSKTEFHRMKELEVNDI